MEIVLRNHEDYRRFLGANGWPDRHIARRVARLAARTCPQAIPRSLALFGARPDVEQLRVWFVDFAKLAAEEAHRSADRHDRTIFDARLSDELGEEFWRTARHWGPPIVFTHHQRAAAAIPEATRARWADLWFDLARGHDEFGCVERSDMFVALDSRENFEQNYSGWYAYFK